jgi:hypothetical protein
MFENLVEEGLTAILGGYYFYFILFFLYHGHVLKSESDVLSNKFRNFEQDVYVTLGGYEFYSICFY